MRRATSQRKRFEVAGLAALVVGAVLLGTAVIVSASSSSQVNDCQNASCTITVSPDSGLISNGRVLVEGAHFARHAHGALVECNMDPAAPTVAIPDNKHDKIRSFGSLPVGCTAPEQVPVTVKKNGGFALSLTITTNTIGPPAAGTDSAGGSAAADAADYPCPPTQTQSDEGVSCAIVFRDTVGRGKKMTNETASEAIHFEAQATTTTVTSTTTTNPACTSIPTAGSGFNMKKGTVATVTVDPGSCLLNGTVVTITAEDLAPSSVGTLAECNSDPTQPTVSYLGATFPVSCSKPVLFSTGADGGIPSASQSFNVVEGTVGPPVVAVDSGGNSSTADAADYPCPPTQAQVSAGDTCEINVTTVAGDKVNVPIFFNPPIGS
jgi:hypothetical protein